MAKQEVNIGVEGNDGTGDSIRESFRKVNENFTELYAVFGQGGTIRFTSLSDTPDNLSPNTIPLVNDAGTEINLVELASNNALDENADDTITFSYDAAGKLVISTAFTEVADDQAPSLGGPMNATAKGIAGVAINTQAAEDINNEHGTTYTIDDLVISKGYADRRYVTTGLPIRVADEPDTTDQYTLTVNRYVSGFVEVLNHGLDSGANGTPYTFNAEDTDPTNLVSGTTYYFRYSTDNTFSLHTSQDDAQEGSDAVAATTMIVVTGTIATDDKHILVDEAYDEDLYGNFLADVAMPRKSVVRRTGDDMEGPLYLYDHPGDLSGEGAPNGVEDLQAATKYYVDNTAYSSPTNLFVSTKGDDSMGGVPNGKEGTSFTYAYKTINAAAARAEEIIKTSPLEPGPYFQTITKDNGDTYAPVVEGDVNGPTFEQARLLIEENREYITKEVTGFLAYEYPNFPYNIDLCERDTGLILDAIAFDINRGQTANYLSRIAAERYYSNSSGRLAITTQIKETIAAIEFARDLTLTILANDLYQQKNVDSITKNTTPVVTTSTNHGLSDKNQVIFKNVGGMVQINNETAYVKVLSDQTFELYADAGLTTPYNNLSYDNYTTGGNVGLIYQTEAEQYFGLSDADANAVSGVTDKFNLITNIMQNGIDAGEDIVYGSTYKIVVNNGNLLYIDQGNPENTDTLPGKVITGEVSGAVAEIVSLENNVPSESSNDVFQVNLLKPIDFLPNEPLRYGNFVREKQVTIFVESGFYEEDYPIRLANNVSIKGDEFRRVIIRPKKRVSQSKWASLYFFRDKEFDGLPIATDGSPFYNQNGDLQGYFARHYLTNPTKLANTGETVNNPGGYELAGDILKKNKEFIKEEVIYYIDNNFQDLLYDKTTCQRDLGLIIDAVAYDVALGTNYNSVTAGLAYQRANNAYNLANEQTYTVAGIQKARDLVLALADVAGDATSLGRAGTAFNEVLDIIQNNTPDALSFPVPSSMPSGNADDAATRLQNNRAFIQAEIIAWIADEYPLLSYDDTKCERDVGYIVDALTHDILYSGTWASTVSAQSYFDGTISQLGAGEATATAAAYDRLADVVDEVVRGVAVTVSTTNTETQDTSGTNATTVEGNQLKTLAQIIEDVITAGNTDGLAAIVYPSTSWAAAGVQSAFTDITTDKATVISDTQTFLDNTIISDGFNYNKAKCRRDTGLIIDAIIKDTLLGGQEFTLEAQGEYYSNYISVYNSNGFGGQKNITEAAIQHIATLTSQLLIAIAPTQNNATEEPNISIGSAHSTWTVDTQYEKNEVVLYSGIYYRSVLPHKSSAASELTNPVLWVVVNAPLITVGNLIDLVTYAFNDSYNPPKRNDEMDVFLMSDATICRNITVQGHGGFMCVLDPEGQVLTKSPYTQTSTSFSKSINEKAFRGGMYVDAYVGNLPIRVDSKDSDYILNVSSPEAQGLFIRPPELPCPFYVDGRRFQVNAISNYDGGLGTAKIYLDLDSNNGDGYDETQFDTTPGVVTRDVFLQTAGNRSMLANDFTQINDLGYGLITNNGAFSEQVSTFTYYCQAAFYANNGSEVRALNCSNGYGRFGLVAEGADPNEVPDQVTLHDDMMQPIKAYTDSTYTNAFDDPSITVTDCKVPPTSNSTITIEHPVAGTLNYVISTVTNMSDQDNNGTDGEAGDVFVTGIASVYNISAADAARTAGTYNGVSQTSTTDDGSGATFTIVIDGSGAATVTIENAGVGYIANETLTIAAADIGSTGSNLTFSVQTVFGGGMTNVYSNRVYKLDLKADDVQADDFYGTLQETVTNGTIIDYRHNQNQVFKRVNDVPRLVTRPSTAINFDESDEITYRSISFSPRDDIQADLASDEVLATFEANFNYVSLDIDTTNLSGGYGSAQGDTSISIQSTTVTTDNTTRLTRDLQGNQPPVSLNAPNAYSLIARNIKFIQEEVIAWVNSTYPTLVYDEVLCYRDVGIIADAIAKDLLFDGNANSVDAARNYYSGSDPYVPVDQQDETVAAIDKIKEIITGYILTKTSWSAINTNGVTQDTSGSNAEAGATTDASTLCDYVADTVENGPSGLPVVTTGYRGGMIFAYAGKTYQVIGLTDEGSWHSIDFIDVPASNIDPGTYSGLGLNVAMAASSRTIFFGLPRGATAEITVAISLLRATGHDFTQVGTGSFNDSNYPNVLLGDAENSLAEFYTDSPTASTGQVWERRKGRVFWVSTDQYGFFRVGKFFNVDQATGDITFAGEIGLSNANSLGFKKGVTINEFSADDAFSDDSGQAVPTEKAVGSYLSRRLGYSIAGSQIEAAPVGNRIGPGFLPLNGISTMEGDLDMGGNRIENLANPANLSDVANKGYVDDKVSAFDELDDLRNVELNNVAQNDLFVATGKKRIYIEFAGAGSFAIGNQFYIDGAAPGSTPNGTVVDIEPYTDEILGSVSIVTYTANIGAFVASNTVTNGTATGSIIETPVDEFANASEATSSVINVNVSRAAGETTYDLQIENGSIVNNDVNASAGISQSKLAMQAATTRANATGIAQSDLGLASFDSNDFSVTNGWVTLASNSVDLDDIEQLDSLSVIGNKTGSSATATKVQFSDVVDKGFGIEDKDFTESENTTTTGTILVLTGDITVSDGETITQTGTGAQGTVQGDVYSEDQIVLIGTSGVFNTVGQLTASSSGALGSNSVPVTVQTGQNLQGSVLVKIKDRLYGTTPVSNTNTNNTIARRTSTGSLQATSYVIGGNSNYEILAESSGTLTFKAPAGGTILTAAGSSNPTMNTGGRIRVGDIAANSVNASNFETNSSFTETTSAIASRFVYTSFIEAVGEKDASGTGIGLGANTGFAGAGADVVQVITGGSVRLSVADATTNITNNLDVDGTLNADGNTTLNGTLDVDGATTLNGAVTLGNASSDNIVFSGRVNSNILPAANNNRNIGQGGATPLRFNTVYATVFDGTATTARYADLAENYLADQAYEPGTVLVFGGEQEVTTTDIKANFRVAGVVSTNPAHLMNGDLEGENVVPLALQGRVPCKVIGEVHKGDILVTSAIPGYAIVWNNSDKIGTVIGKAVGSKETSDRGVVEVVVGRV